MKRFLWEPRARSHARADRDDPATVLHDLRGPTATAPGTDKPVAIMGASVGRFGTARAQYHLRQVFVFLNMYAVNWPEVMIGNAAEHFDARGKLTDETTKDLIRQLLRNLVNWTRRLQQKGTAEPAA